MGTLDPTTLDPTGHDEAHVTLIRRSTKNASYRGRIRRLLLAAISYGVGPPGSSHVDSRLGCVLCASGSVCNPCSGPAHDRYDRRKGSRPKRLCLTRYGYYSGLTEPDQGHPGRD